MILPDILRPVFSRVIAGAVASLAAYLQTKYEVVIDPDTKANLVVGALATFSVIYPIGHRLIDGLGKVNPGDAASKTLAVIEKDQQKVATETADRINARTNYPE